MSGPVAPAPGVRGLAALLLASLPWLTTCVANRPEMKGSEPQAADPTSLANREPTPAEANQVRLELAHHMVLAGSYDSAIPLLKRSLAEDPQQPLAHYYMGVVLAEKGQFGPAEQELRLALSQKAELTQAKDRLGMVLMRTGRSEEALTLQRQAVAEQPQHAGYRNNLAYSLFVAGRVDEAIAEYERAVILDPSSRLTYNNLGFAYGRAGRLEQARLAFEQGGSPATARVNLGVLYEELGRREEARAAYEEALRLSPHHVQARANLEALKRTGGADASPLPQEMKKTP